LNRRQRPQRTGRGKTSFKTQVVINWLQQGYDVLDLQTELPEVEAYARYLAQLQQTPWRGLLAQRGQPAAVRDLRAWAAHHLDEHLTLLEFDGQRSLGEVVDEYVRLRGKIPLICVDVVQDLATFYSCRQSCSNSKNKQSAIIEIRDTNFKYSYVHGLDAL
jgi:hypothetical protein